MKSRVNDDEEKFKLAYKLQMYLQHQIYDFKSDIADDIMCHNAVN